MRLLAKIVWCRIVGHRPATAVRYERHAVVVAAGCSRCGAGAIETRPVRQYPLPFEVRR